MFLRFFGGLVVVFFKVDLVFFVELLIRNYNFVQHNFFLISIKVVSNIISTHQHLTIVLPKITLCVVTSHKSFQLKRAKKKPQLQLPES